MNPKLSHKCNSDLIDLLKEVLFRIMNAWPGLIGRLTFGMKSSTTKCLKGRYPSI